MILGQLNTYMENQENKSSIEENTDDLHDFKLNTFTIRGKYPD